MWNHKVNNQFWTFDSKLEFTHFMILNDFSKKYWLSLKRQVTYILVDWFEVNDKISGKKKYQPITYIADFVLYDKKWNDIAVIDSKWFKTEKFMLKQKMFASKFLKNLILLKNNTPIIDIERIFKMYSDI
jgi:type I site-specific restriction endonuclease